MQDDHGTQATLHYALLGTGVALAGVAAWLFLDSGGDEAPAEGASAVITPEGFEASVKHPLMVESVCGSSIQPRGRQLAPR